MLENLPGSHISVIAQTSERRSGVKFQALHQLRPKNPRQREQQQPQQTTHD
jgi:hypothetical protein